MRTHLKKILGVTALSMSVLTNTAPTWAGAANAPQVSIVVNNGEGYASGSLVGARYSADNLQSIQCTTHSTPLYLYCDARDSAGNSLECASADPKHLEALQSMTDSSHIYFQVEKMGDHSRCSYLAIYNSSGFLK